MGFCLKPLRSRDPALPTLYGHAVGHLSVRKTRMRIVSTMCWKSRERRGRCEFWLYIMSPSKVCPQCQASVPLNLEVCKSCQHVFRSKRKAEDYSLSVKSHETRESVKGQEHQSKLCIDSSRAESPGRWRA